MFTTNPKPRKAFKWMLVLAVLLLTVSTALAQEGSRPNRAERLNQQVPTTLNSLRLDQPVTATSVGLPNSRVAESLLQSSGRVRVVVRLDAPSVSAAAAEGLEANAQLAAREAIGMQQNTVVANARSLDNSSRVLATLKLALNAVVLEIDAAALPSLAANPNVVAINPVRDFQMALSETVPYIGATAVQEEGFDGTGIRVAVLDSGIDYYHANLGGSGDPAEYAADDPTVIEPDSFPTAKVVGGMDFVGSQWDGSDGIQEAPDPDPLDDGPGAGHGTHVADILGGTNGVAPGVSLYAVKVCSSVSTACSGLAILQGLEFALDPNGDGDVSDRVDIINMSLGSLYGDPRHDDTSLAVENAAALGVLVVTAAGNGSDKPYVMDTPGATTSSFTVAQTFVPSAVQPILEVLEPASIAGEYAAVFRPWSGPLTERLEAPLQYGDGAGGHLDGCSLGDDPESSDPADAPFPPGSLAGKIVLVDRGTCFFSTKIRNIEVGGGMAGIIGQNVPGPPFGGSFGDGPPVTIPGYMISLDDADTLRAGLDEGTVTVAFDPATGLPLVMHTVGSSSRGPSFGSNLAKPDIGAPGASVSAIAGSGSGTEPFSGTSGSTPMIAGSAALLMQAYPERNWAEIRAMLMNTAETDIMNAAAFFGGYIAPISRIGGGEVRVDAALHTELAAWERNTLAGSLSWGFHDVWDQQTLVQRVTIQNYSGRNILLRTVPEFRFEEDSGGEVRLSAPSYFTVPSHGRVTIPVHLYVRPRQDRPLHNWVMDGGAGGADPDALTFNEYDGYLHFEEVGNADNAIHIPWHILPRSAGNVEYGTQQNGFSWVRNTGKAETLVDTFSLIGLSDDLPEGGPGEQSPTPDFKYIGVQTYPVPAGFCSDVESFVMGFAVHTWERITLPNTVIFEFDLDTDPDNPGPEYAVVNADLNFLTQGTIDDGRNATWVINTQTGEASAFFFTQHATNSANTLLLFCGEQIGMNAEDFFTTSFGVDAFAIDLYYEGPGDQLLGMNVVPLGERYLVGFDNGDAVTTLLPPRSGKLGVFVLDFGEQLNATEIGILSLTGPGAPEGNEAQALILQAP